MPQGGAKDENFSCFHSSCQWELKYTYISMVTYSPLEQLKRYFIYEKVSNRNWLTHNKDLEKISAQIFQKKVTIYRMLHLVWPLLSRMCIIICCYNRASCAHGAQRANTSGPNVQKPAKKLIWKLVKFTDHT